MFNWLFPDKNFDKAIAVVLKHEGLLTNNPSDPGGITNYGVSLRFLRAAGIDENGVRSGHITAQDIIALTPDKAEKIYYKYFWKANHFDLVVSTMLSTSLLDMSILMGAEEAIELMQSSMNLLLEDKIMIDGKMGSETINSLNMVNSYQLNQRFKQSCITHFDNLCIKNTKLSVFKEGWTNRVDDL